MAILVPWWCSFMCQWGLKIWMMMEKLTLMLLKISILSKMEGWVAMHIAFVL